MNKNQLENSKLKIIELLKTRSPELEGELEGEIANYILEKYNQDTQKDIKELDGLSIDSYVNKDFNLLLYQDYGYKEWETKPNWYIPIGDLSERVSALLGESIPSFLKSQQAKIIKNQDGNYILRTTNSSIPLDDIKEGRLNLYKHLIQDHKIEKISSAFNESSLAIDISVPDDIFEDRKKLITIYTGCPTSDKYNEEDIRNIIKAKKSYKRDCENKWINPEIEFKSKPKMNIVPYEEDLICKSFKFEKLIDEFPLSTILSDLGAIHSAYCWGKDEGSDKIFWDAFYQDKWNQLDVIKEICDFSLENLLEGKHNLSYGGMSSLFGYTMNFYVTDSIPRNYSKYKYTDTQTKKEVSKKMVKIATNCNHFNFAIKALEELEKYEKDSTELESIKKEKINLSYLETKKSLYNLDLKSYVHKTNPEILDLKDAVKSYKISLYSDEF